MHAARTYDEEQMCVCVGWLFIWLIKALAATTSLGVVLYISVCVLCIARGIRADAVSTHTQDARARAHSYHCVYHELCKR